ncbi:hypothetical protein D1BOALGB6SA_6211 [Olavius sp. associated proteobacterium Delta 1]|nr:hypothetical protein D1BOALGB6SA_6211 [Olavius sp. associated proteobacterium Delta 1]
MFNTGQLMNPPQKTVISASRRTDIPAFYMPWFMEQIKKGFFEVVNPFNQRVSVVPATPHVVHTIVFWSKNFGPFIDEGFGERLLKQGYYLFFNFTINSDNPILEPNVPPLKERIDQLKHLSQHFGSRSISWRFDPICYYETGQGSLHDNLGDFSAIGEQAAAVGIERCITSFMDYYPKIRKRLSFRPGLVLTDPPLIDKVNTLIEMETRLAALNIHLTTCCEKEVIAALPPGSSISPSSCIPNDLLMELYGGNLALRKDTGQRVKAGCGCKVSVDIGSYRHQPCYHNCLFCYANPNSGKSG